MNASWLLLPVIAALLVAAMAGLSAARNAGALSPECARKLFHVSMGIMTLSFPWLFSDPAPVLLLACIACIWFEAVRRLAPLARNCGSVLSNVARPGRGEIHFVAGTALTFVLAEGNALAFCLPMSILALADAAAALVGKRFGDQPGAIRFGDKSLAGSSTFFAVALFAGLTGLSLAGWPAAQSIALAVLIACATTALEAVARRGADNLLIPVGAALLLRCDAVPTMLPAGILVLVGLVSLGIAATSACALWQTRKALP
jgi:phytol kinase